MSKRSSRAAMGEMTDGSDTIAAVPHETAGPEHDYDAGASYGASGGSQSANGARPRAPKGPRNVTYLIIGVRQQDGQQVIIGRQPTRGRCRKQIEMLLDALRGAYSDFVIIKGRFVSVTEILLTPPK